jgi:hypothetical protein
MKKASVSEAKNKPRRPVARLVPVNGLLAGTEGRLARLVREGVVRPARGAVPEAVFATRPPRVKRNASGVGTLLDERRQSR